MPAPPLDAELGQRLTEAGVRVEARGRRTDVVLSAPERRNAQSPPFWLALADLGVSLRDSADVVVLRAEGPSFSAGLDRRLLSGDPAAAGAGSLLELASADDATVDERIASYQAGFTVWSTGRFLTVAAVQGHAVGAGFQLALAADVRIAADDAQFCMREPALGLVPDLGGTGPLVDAVGYARAVEICATARWVHADEALAIGLVQSVVPAGSLLEAVDTFVAAVSANSWPAALATRDLLRGAAGRTRDERLAAERRAQAARLRALLGPRG